MPPEPEEAEPQIIDGPDPSEWPVKAPEMWRLVLDIEALDRIARAMNGPVAQDAGPDYEEARRFLDYAGRQLRATLGTMIIDTYQVTRTEGDTSPFSAAGKPRAFGADQTGAPAST